MTSTIPFTEGATMSGMSSSFGNCLENWYRLMNLGSGAHFLWRSLSKVWYPWKNSVFSFPPLTTNLKRSDRMSSDSPWKAKSMLFLSSSWGRMVSSQTPGPPTTSLAFFPALALLTLAIRASNSHWT